MWSTHKMTDFCISLKISLHLEPRSTLRDLSMSTLQHSNKSMITLYWLIFNPCIVILPPIEAVHTWVFPPHLSCHISQPNDSSSWWYSMSFPFGWLSSHPTGLPSPRYALRRWEYPKTLAHLEIHTVAWVVSWSTTGHLISQLKVS